MESSASWSACSSASSGRMLTAMNPFDLPGPQFLGLYAFFGFAVVLGIVRSAPFQMRQKAER